MTDKKITLATIKSFIKNNQGNLFIQVKSDFDGMTDCVQSVKGDFVPVTGYNPDDKNTLGLNGAWFVGSSRDYFSPYCDATYEGYHIYNCCGSWNIATKRG